MKVERAKIPVLLNGVYRTYVMEDLQPPVSNIPYSNDKSVDLTELIVKPVCDIEMLIIIEYFER